MLSYPEVILPIPGAEVGGLFWVQFLALDRVVAASWPALKVWVNGSSPSSFCRRGCVGRPECFGLFCRGFARYPVVSPPTRRPVPCLDNLEWQIIASSGAISRILNAGAQQHSQPGTPHLHLSSPVQHSIYSRPCLGEPPKYFSYCQKCHHTPSKSSTGRSPPMTPQQPLVCHSTPAFNTCLLPR